MIRKKAVFTAALLAAASFPAQAGPTDAEIAAFIANTERPDTPWVNAYEYFSWPQEMRGLFMQGILETVAAGQDLNPHSSNYMSQMSCRRSKIGRNAAEREIHRLRSALVRPAFGGAEPLGPKQPVARRVVRAITSACEH